MMHMLQMFWNAFFERKFLYFSFNLSTFVLKSQLTIIIASIGLGDGFAPWPNLDAGLANLCL